MVQLVANFQHKNKFLDWLFFKQYIMHGDYPEGKFSIIYKYIIISIGFCLAEIFFPYI